MPNNCVFLMLFFFAMMLVSCDSNRVFDEYKSVPNEWDKDAVISFKMTPQDSVQPYNLYVNIRNTNNYKFSNLFLIVEMVYPHGKTIKDTLEYQMAKPNGELLGQGMTDIKENKLWYKGYENKFVFDEMGEYNIKIQHAMRNNGEVNGVDKLQGISDIGFRVESITN